MSDLGFQERPVALDLFCGRGGWAHGLIAEGFTVYGFDINPQPDFPGIFVQVDILSMTAADFAGYGAVFGTCSSPCEQFSVHGMKHFHPNPPFPTMGIKLFNHARQILEDLGIPYVMENVRAAQNFIGKSTAHCGPFHMWGPGVPALFPREAYKVTKGMKLGSSTILKTMSIEEKREIRRKYPMMMSSHGSKLRDSFTAAMAMIPEQISSTVAKAAASLVAMETT